MDGEQSGHVARAIDHARVSAPAARELHKQLRLQEDVVRHRPATPQVDAETDRRLRAVLGSSSG